MPEHTEHHETPRSGHPIEAFLCSVLDDLKGLADVPAWSMDEATTTRVVGLAARVAAGVAEVESRAVAQADSLGLPASAGCRDLRRWLQQQTHVTRRTATAKTALAKGLSNLESTRLAAARGEVHAEQAETIAKEIAKLDDERVSAHDQRRAEEFLLGEAADRDADDLGRLGHEIWTRLDPEGADERESKALEAQEERARRRTKLSMRDDGQGLTHGTFSIPTAQASMFRKQLHGFAAPKHVRANQGAGSFDWQRPSAEKLGQAFVEWIETYDPTKLPKIGGLSATVVVVADLDATEGTVKAATMDTGVKISHAQTIRMACDAGIVPMWMNADGEVLAMGRKTRFHTPAQRLAAIVEQKHCQHHSGCDVPGYLCHLHHKKPWAQGGKTDLRDTELLCPFHHHQAHAADTADDYPMRT